VFRRRLLAVLLDLLVPAAAADAVGLLLTAAVWRMPPRRGRAALGLGALAAAAVGAFLLRDSRGGRARRWLAMEAAGAGWRPAGALGLDPTQPAPARAGWNLYDAWPLTRDGAGGASLRPSPGIRISNSE
jgi:hypothetical protein